MSQCELCKFKKQDPRFGEFFQTKEIGVHEFCLYLSSALVQRGKDNNGLCGFLPRDIRAEAERAKDLICFYCHQAYATIGCCKSKCRRSFHMSCGIENGCENQFCGTFQSYCHSHIHKIWHKHPPRNDQCCICYDRLREIGKPNHRVDFIEAPCCKNGWFHKLCLQKFARTAGYFFKCPLCNNTNQFRSEMPSRGIFVPDRDAEWELEPNAFAELLERPKKCVAEICHHKNGRNADDDEHNPLMYCVTCGSVAVHLLCLPKNTSSYTCEDCLHIAGPHTFGDSGHGSLQDVNDEHESKEEERKDIDVCILSDSEDEDDDILERYFLPKKRQIIYDSSDSNESVIAKNQNEGSPRDNNESSTDDEIVMMRASLNIKANKNKVNVSAETSTSKANKCRNNNLRNIVTISSDDEDSDESCESTQFRVVKRRKMLESNANQANEQLKTKAIENLQTMRKPLNKSVRILRNHNKNDSDSHYMLSCNANSAEPNNRNSLNISCVANRTRRRKSVYYTNSLKTISESDSQESNENVRTSYTTNGKNRASSSKRNSSAYCSFSDFLSNSDTSKVSPSSLSTTSTRSSSSSATTTTTTTTSSACNSKNAIFNVSCVANRTRRRSGQCNKTDTNLVSAKNLKSSSSGSDSDDFQITKRQNKINKCLPNLNTLSSTDDSLDFSHNKRYGVKVSRRLRLISTTEDEDDDAMKNR